MCRFEGESLHNGRSGTGLQIRMSLAALADNAMHFTCLLRRPVGCEVRREKRQRSKTRFASSDSAMGLGKAILHVRRAFHGLP